MMVTVEDQSERRWFQYAVLVDLALNLVGGHKIWYSAAPYTGWESTSNSCNTILPPVVHHNTTPDRKSDHGIKRTALC